MDRALGVTETAYHAVAVTLGTVAGICTVVGVAILIYRRRTVGPVFSATTRNDKAMYVVLMPDPRSSAWAPRCSAT